LRTSPEEKGKELPRAKAQKFTKFGEIKVGAAKKSWEAARGLRELSVLAGKEFRGSVSRKGAKGAKVRIILRLRSV